jgi:O-methyltransferase
MNLRPLPFGLGPPLVRAAQRLLNAAGFDIVDLRPSHPGIKDAEFYRPTFSPWTTSEWMERLRGNDPRSLLPIHARYILCCLAMDAIRRSAGDIAECGVYRGGTARILAQFAEDRAYLFDTFSGMPDTDPVKDIYKAGDFSDTSLESVREYLADFRNVKSIAGMIPESLKVVADCQFAFVHIDLDIYASIKAACEFFYPRLQPGGTLLFDDYGHANCPGARAAVDEFFVGKPETPFVMVTGQCAVQKL